MKGTAQHWTFKLKAKTENAENDAFIMSYYPRNG